MHTRRRLLALASWALIGPTALAWSGHPASRSVVTITADALRKLIESGRAPVLPVDLRSTDAYRAGRLPGLALAGWISTRRPPLDAHV